MFAELGFQRTWRCADCGFIAARRSAVTLEDPRESYRQDADTDRESATAARNRDGIHGSRKIGRKRFPASKSGTDAVENACENIKFMIISTQQRIQYIEKRFIRESDGRKFPERSKGRHQKGGLREVCSTKSPSPQNDHITQIKLQ